MKKEILYNKDDEQISPVIYSDSIEDKGEPNGVATLDENGKIPESQLPISGQGVKWVDF